MTNRIAMRASLSSLGILCIATLLTASSTVQAANTTYYINNLPGSGCSNSGAGTSTAAPWCDFVPTYTRTFGPGDTIRLRRGATWTQELLLVGNGSPSAWNTLEAYGTGNRPRISLNNDATARGIRMNDSSYWRVRDLEIDSAGAGILLRYTTMGHEGLSFDNLYLHDIRGIFQGNNPGESFPHDVNGTNHCPRTDNIWTSAGIVFTGPSMGAANNYAVRNISITNIEGTRNTNSIAFDWCNGYNYSGPGSGYQHVQNVFMMGLNFHDDNGKGVGPNHGCGEGFRLSAMQNVTVMASSFVNEASCNTWSGTAGLLLGRVNNVKFLNNIIAFTPHTASNDQCGVDFELWEDSVEFIGNHISGNAGGGLAFLAIHAGDTGGSHVVKGNTFVHNGTARKEKYMGAISRVGGQFNPSAMIRENLHYEPSGFLGVGGGGTFTNMTIQRNDVVAGSAHVYHSANGFTGTQGLNGWSYQYWNGTLWESLTYDAASQVWKPSSGAGIPVVTRWGLHPGTSALQSAARAWTAKFAGKVAIRGRVLKADLGGGDGVTAQVTKNGAVIWGPTNLVFDDKVGVDTNLDNVAVATNDVIRFEIGTKAAGNNANDSTSWTPAVGYLSIDADTSPNLALTATATASTTFSGYSASRVNDTITSTAVNGGASWANDGVASLPQTLQLSWEPAAPSFNRVELYTSESGYAMRDYSIEYWDGSHWRDCLSQDTYPATVSPPPAPLVPPLNYVAGNELVRRTHTFPRVSGTKLRVVGRQGPLIQTAFVRVNELEVYNDGVSGTVGLTDSGFESPALSAGGYVYQPGGTSWTFGPLSGIAANASAFTNGNSSAPQGVQVAFLQGAGSFERTLSGLQVGKRYVVNFSAAHRANFFDYQGTDAVYQTLYVYLDDFLIGTYNPMTSSYKTFSSAPFVATATSHKLRFVGGTPRDATVFIDNIVLGRN